MNASDRIRQHLLMQIDDSECGVATAGGSGLTLLILAVTRDLESRINESFDTASPRDQAVHQLNLDKQELKDLLDAVADQLQVANERASKSDALCAELELEVASLRRLHAQLDEENVSPGPEFSAAAASDADNAIRPCQASLEETIEELNARLAHLTAQSYSATQHQAQPQAIKELQGCLERESHERADAQRLQRAAERSARESRRDWRSLARAR